MRKKTEEKLKVIKEMHLNGSSLEEIAEATGYKDKTVYDMLVTNGIMKPKTKIEPETLVFAKDRPRKSVKVSIRGKKYLDVTSVFID